MDNGAINYRRFLDGEENAFVEIMKEYRYGLTFFINQYVKDMDAAEDLAIDVFTDLIVHRNRYNFKTTFKTYLFMIGRSRAIDYLRHHKKFVIVDLSEVENELVAVDFVEKEILADERKKILNDAIRQLPEDMAIVVHLIYFENLSHEEVAKVMKKSRKQVYNLLYRAKNMLRTILGKDGELLL